MPLELEGSGIFRVGAFINSTVRRIVGHKVDSSTLRVTLRVQWEGLNDITYHGFYNEFVLQDADEHLVLSYWEELGGQDAATQLEVYLVHKILKENNRWGYLIQWTEYSSLKGDTTWESRDKINEICPEAVDDWLAFRQV
ncbi:hypothetical protein FDECE_11143 [Fusarium decemcellulare]|nr:hypothetical protein FDECE_11143 [Fusarium decemcellulare]